MATDEPTQLTTRILVEIRDEVRSNGQQLTEVRGELKEVRSDIVEIRGDVTGLRTDMTQLKSDVTHLQGDMTEVRSDVTEIRGELAHHGALLNEHGRQLGFLGVTIKQVLRAVTHGNATRDGHVTDHESRITRLEERAGLEPL